MASALPLLLPVAAARATATIGTKSMKIMGIRVRRIPLRKWFAHDPAKWKKFQQRYWKELADQDQAVKLLRQQAQRGRVTLIYAARDEEHNGAVALKAFLERRKR